MGNRKNPGTIRSVTVIDPETGKIAKNMDICITGSSIETIKASTDSPAEGVFDGRGLFAIPGLIDTHVHTLGVYVEKLPGLFDLEWVFRQQRKNLSCFLRSGVTTIRDMGAPLKLIQNMSRKAERKDSGFPRILYAGPVLTVEGGYPYFIKKTPFILNLITGPVCIYVTGRLSARRTVDMLADSGVNCIKVMYQTMKYDDRRTKIKALPRQWLIEIIDRAHKHGLPVAMHHIYRSDLLQIVDLPFDSLEHLACDEVLADDEVAKLAKKDIPVSTTMMTYGIIDHVERYEELLKREPERLEPKPRRTVRRAIESLKNKESISRYFGKNVIITGSTIMRKNLKKLDDAGVAIVNGTDSGGAITPTGCPHWEFIDMKRAGMTDLDALRTATSVAAEAIGRDDLGRLRQGATADIVLLRSNPLLDIEAISEVAAVFRGGRLVHDAINNGK